MDQPDQVARPDGRRRWTRRASRRAVIYQDSSSAIASTARSTAYSGGSACYAAIEEAGSLAGTG
jgi:hypothetical protein